jgi:hypothetical protein
MAGVFFRAWTYEQVHAAIYLERNVIAGVNSEKDVRYVGVKVVRPESARRADETLDRVQ